MLPACLLTVTLALAAGEGPKPAVKASGRDRIVPIGSGGFDMARRISALDNGDVVVSGVYGEPGLFVGLEATAVTSGPALGPGDPAARSGGSFVARIAPDGRPRWVRTGDAGNLDQVVELSDGRLLAVGRASNGPVGFDDVRLQVRAWGGEGDRFTRGENAVAYWIEANGRVVAGRAYGDDGVVRATAALPLDDGAALLGGSFEGVVEGVASAAPTRGSNGGAGPTGSWDDTDGYLLAVDRAGAVRWRAFVDGDGQDEVTNLARLAGGDLLVAGTTRETPTFVDALGKKVTKRCGFPVQCPFLWRLDASTGATRAVIVLKNGSGMPDVASLLPLDDGGFAVLGNMGRNLTLSSSSPAASTIQLRTESAEGHAWAARYDAAMSLDWAVRVDERGQGGVIEGALLADGGLLVAGAGSIGGGGSARPRRGEGPAVFARLALEDGAPLGSLAFGRPADAPLTSSGANVRIEDVAATGHGVVALLTEVQERAFFTLADGPIDVVTMGTRLRTQDRYANEMDVVVLLLHDVDVLGTPAVPVATTAAHSDPIVGCVARKELSLLVPCAPAPRAAAPGRVIRGTCIDGTWGVGDRRVWSCGPLDDDIALSVRGRELIFREHTAEGRLVLYQDIASGHRAVTAQLLDDRGKPL